MTHDAEAELRRLRIELATCQQELNQYRRTDMLPTTSQAPPRPDLRGNMYTITLKARSEFSDNVDNLKVASILGHDNYGAYVCSFVFNTDSLGCAWLVIKFGT